MLIIHHNKAEADQKPMSDGADPRIVSRKGINLNYFGRVYHQNFNLVRPDKEYATIIYNNGLPDPVAIPD